MKFYSAYGSRPVRLSENTRRFAEESLLGKYGQEAEKTPYVFLDDIPDLESLSPLEKHDAAIRRIAEAAPVRICENELISGSATLGAAIDHVIPAYYHASRIFYSVSHLTVDFETVLRHGTDFIREKVRESLKVHAGTEREAFLISCENCLDSLEIYHSRYLDALLADEKYADNYRALKQVPMQPPTSFREAVQSLWFTFSFIRLCGNWPGIGRIDMLLGDYLKNDLEKGVLTLGEAREILAHFFIKGCEWITGSSNGSGDAQHYQNLVIGGIDEDGNELTNEVTYLVLDILEEFNIGDYPTTVRLSRSSPEKLLRRTAEVIRHGGGALAVYNEDLILEALTQAGYPLRDARRFANDGCWEVQIPGETFFIYSPFDSLRCLAAAHGCYTFGDRFDTFEDLYAAYRNELENNVKGIRNGVNSRFVKSKDDPKSWKYTPQPPCTVVSLFEKGCIEKGLSYHEGGPIYNVHSPHIGGLPDTVNSLYAIKKLVFEEKKLKLWELFAILQNNWEGEETLRQYVLNKYVYFGNDNDECDELAARIVSDFADLCQKYDENCGYHFFPGISTFGRQIEWADLRPASAFGKRSGDILAGNFSPTPGTDADSATAVIRSYCKADLRRMTTGAALDLKLLPGSVKGEDGINAIVALMKSFVQLGGYFMQIDVCATDILREAQRDPENYATLSVRVSGWNARFVTLNKEWQDMIIGQSDSSVKPV